MYGKYDQRRSSYQYCCGVLRWFVTRAVIQTNCLAPRRRSARSRSSASRSNFFAHCA